MDAYIKTHLRAGQTLGPYQLLRPLDRSRTIEVWLARHRSSHELAALKLLRQATLAGEELALHTRRLHHEARMLATFQHPHIIKYQDYRLAHNVRYLAMQYAKFGSIAQYHPAGRKLSLTQTRVYAWQVGLALYELHLRGLIHRDVKPDNILLLHEYHAALADFGLVMRDPIFSQEGLHKAGTVAYMSLEQYNGYPCAASDQYSLAVCVYEWLTGDVPFYGEARQMMRLRERFEPLPVTRFRPELSDEVDRVMLTALHRDPAGRYGTVLDFVHELMKATRILRPPRIRASGVYARRVYAPDTADLIDPSPLALQSEEKREERHLFGLPALLATLRDSVGLSMHQDIAH